MAYEAEKVRKVRGLGMVYRVSAPLDEQLRAFEKVGIHTLASLDELARIRLAGISESESRTNVAPVTIKGGKTILLRNSPLMDSCMDFIAASAAVKAHIRGKYFETGREIYEAAEELANAQREIEPEERSAIFVSQDENFFLKTNMDEARFLFGKHNQRYFKEFVKHGKEGQIPFYGLTGDSKDRAIVNYLWFDAPQNESGLSCKRGCLSYDDLAFGVLKVQKAYKKI